MNICRRGSQRVSNSGWIVAALCLAPGAAYPAVHPQMPVAFIPNQGQVEPAVRYVSSGAGFQAMFYDRKVLVRQGKVHLQVHFPGALPTAVLAGYHPTGATANYLHGDDPAGWKTGIPMQGELGYHNLWRGIDLRYRGVEQSLKAEYIAAAGADIADIHVSYQGQVRIDNDGSLVVRGLEGEYREDRPVLYQGSGTERREVKGGYRVIDSSTVGFWAAPYDHSRELVIDPTITYSTLFGGNSQDSVNAVAYDATLNAYIAGFSSSSDLPAVNAARPRGGSVDAFVAKFGVGSGKLIYCTYLGGSGDDRAFGLAVAPSGEAFVTGWTSSVNFPISNAAQNHLGGSRSAFITKLNSAGNGLAYSTYFGGSGVTVGNGIAIDPAGEVAIAGDTTSANLPASGTFQTLLKGGQDAFVLKFKPAGQISLVSYFGGSGTDHAASIAMDATGAMIFGGNTFSTDLPTASAYQASNTGSETGFVASLPADGKSLLFSTYFGGSGGSGSHPEGVTSVAIDPNSSLPSIFVGGITSSADFPVTAGAYQPGFGGGSDGYLARFATTGGLLSSTFFGGSLNDGVNAIAVDFYGNPHVAGYTSSTDFPVSRPVQNVNKGSRDAFVAKFDKNLDKVMYSTYLGGVGTDAANSIAVDGMCTVLVAGQTGSADFPLVKAQQTAKNEPLAGFLTKIAPGWSESIFYHGLWFIDSTHSRGSDGTTFPGTVFSFGQTGDIPVTGDWDGSGKRKIGVFRNGTWILDSNGNGQLDASDRTFVFGKAGDFPVVGDWDGTGRVRAGLFRQGVFILDFSGHLTGVSTGKSDVTFSFGQTNDIPVAGDWNGSGSSKVGVFRSGQWILNSTGDHVTTHTYTYGQAGDFPVAGDWDGSGASKIGIFRNPAWCFDYDGDNALTSPGLTELLFFFGIPGVYPVIL